MSAFDYVRDDERRRIEVTARRVLRADDLITIVDRQVTERTWSYGILYDLRAAIGATPRADADVVAARVRMHLIADGQRGPVALVTSTPDMVGAGQLYAFKGAMVGLNVEVFVDFDDAERWLDLQAEQV